MNVVVWVPWGDLMHEEQDIGGKFWRRGPGNNDWWTRRVDIFARYTFKSALQQKVRPNALVCGVAMETPDGYPDKLAAVLREQRVLNASIFYHPAKATVGRGQNPPLSFLRQLAPLAPVAVMWLDSDDCVSRRAVQLVGTGDAVPGRVMLFRSGYLFDTSTQRMFVYNPGSCPPPFFARVYTRDAFTGKDALEQYDTEWGYRRFHHQLTGSRNPADLEPGHFCVLSHGTNTSTSLTSERVQSKLTVEVTEATKVADLRREFGL